MFETAFAQLRFAHSLLSGRPFHLPSLERLLAAAVATRQEFGSLEQDAQEFVSGPPLDEATRLEMQLRRLRTQLRRALEETTYYPQLLADMALEPRRLTWDIWRTLPLTMKETLRDQPDAFVRRAHSPTFLTMTTGTTGMPTTMTFSDAELTVYELLSAFSMLFQSVVANNDIVQVSTSARSLLANSIFMGSCRRLGALVYQTGVIDPNQTLSLLSRRHDLPGKKTRPSVLLTYPSYLGRLVELGLRQGYGPSDFGLEQIFLGGEIVTQGIIRRAQALFGPVDCSDAYGITEVWPFGGTPCEQGHLHFEPSTGLLEVLDPDSGQPAAAGAVGTLVLTPFAPYRETVVILRYNTQDLVRQLAEPPTCSLRSQPATSNLLGKKALAVRHAAGWTAPRDVLEAIEGIDALPLPARCGFWVEERESGQSLVDKVTVEVAAPEALRADIVKALEARSVPLGSLILVDDPRRLLRPLPWRGDLHESSFGERNAAILAEV